MQSYETSAHFLCVCGHKHDLHSRARDGAHHCHVFGCGCDAGDPAPGPRRYTLLGRVWQPGRCLACGAPSPRGEFCGWACTSHWDALVACMVGEQQDGHVPAPRWAHRPATRQHEFLGRLAQPAAYGPRSSVQQLYPGEGEPAWLDLYVVGPTWGTAPAVFEAYNEQGRCGSYVRPECSGRDPVAFLADASAWLTIALAREAYLIREEVDRASVQCE